MEIRCFIQKFTVLSPALQVMTYNFVIAVQKLKHTCFL